MGVVLTLLWWWAFRLVVQLAVGRPGGRLVLRGDGRTSPRPVRLFLDPFADVDNRTFQAAHSIYAFSNGGWWGRGLGAASRSGAACRGPHRLHLRHHRRRARAAGTLMVIVLFLVLGFAGIRIAWNTRDPFIRLAAAGITAGYSFRPCSTWVACCRTADRGRPTAAGLLRWVGVDAHARRRGCWWSFARQERGGRRRWQRGGKAGPS